MAARARQTTLALLAAAPVVAGLWIAAAQSRETSGASRLFDSHVDHITAALLITSVIAVGICTVAATGRATRWLGLRARASLIGATAVSLTTIVGDLAALIVLSARLADLPGTIHKLVVAEAVAASCASVLLASRGSWSCIAMSRAARATGRCDRHGRET